MNWHVRDFHPEDLEAAIRLDAASTMTAQQPLFDASDVVTSLQERHPAVVAVVHGAVVGVAVSRVDADRAWVLRLSLDPAWRGKGLGSTLLNELEHRLLARGVRRITAILPDGETGSTAFVNSGFIQRSGIAHFDKHETMSPRSAAVLTRLGGSVPPAGQWQQIAGMVREKTLIERRIVLPLSLPEQAAEHGVVPPQAIVLFGPPGTGKTTFARAIASRLGWPFVELFPSRLAVNGGGLAAGLSEAFGQLQELDNVVAFIDEVEEVASHRGAGSAAATAVVNELLKCLVQFRDRAGRLLVCATNSIRDLDSAFLRHGRFDYVLPIGPPDDQALDGLWRRYIADADIDIAALVSATGGYTPADVAHAARAVAQATFERSVDTGVRCQATTADYLHTVTMTRPTLTIEQVCDFDTEISAFART
ncbi:bifunctional GNAT family N-acetyltransferase/ATP-binding protein [Mycolicibacterium sp. 624]|uniref:ATP-binding protein n=1 Tax=Mycolicibacterium sp. 624 TaxID=3156314 RepID=UPI003394883E